MWLVGVVVRRYIDFLILLIPTPLVFAFLQQHPYFYFLFIIIICDRTCEKDPYVGFLHFAVECKNGRNHIDN